MDDGCCKDENLVIKNAPDFTLKEYNNYDLVKTFCDLFYLPFTFTDAINTTPFIYTIASIKIPPPKLQNTLVISTSVLRI